ncbi:hypothetical protein QBC46DRAFT_367211 [Diplogelasinospora grovesii]|uniref:Uncharacterized protein n=1 Tax=Diplogelasinospora grovesii TaxID=303347 RepID=A0AAN6MYN9_9PEZI|nr:hypothetical protein QBC46DRAFT_367211 [Diplogelasinospora grovesii]
MVLRLEASPSTHGDIFHSFSLSLRVFYTPPVTAGLKLTSHSVLAQNRNPFTAIFKAPLHLPPLQDTYDPRRGGFGDSPDNAVLISDGEFNCDNSDDSDDGRFDTTFSPLKELPTAPRNKGVNALPGASSNNDVKEPSMAGASLAEFIAKGHGYGLQHDLRPFTGLYGKTSNREGTICFNNDEWDRRFSFSLKAIRQPDLLKSILNSHHRGQSPRSAASSHGVQTQSDSCRLSQNHDHRGGSDQTSDPEHYHPPASNDRGEQNKEGSESRASILRLLDDESNNEHRVNLQHDISHRRYYNIDNEEDYHPIKDSVTKYGQDKDVVQPPRKHRKISTSALITRGTALKWQTRGSTLKEELVEAPVAKFEEWPLNDVVLKRVILKFKWNAYRTPESLWHKSLAERTSSMGRALPLRVAFIAEEV